MAIRPIVRFPDPRLRLEAEPIVAFDDELRRLAQDLAETMRAAPGIGIAAPHIGVLKRLVVIQLETDASPHVFVNPQVVWSSSEMIRHMEGSVSMPGVTARSNDMPGCKCATRISMVWSTRRRRRD